MPSQFKTIGIYGRVNNPGVIDSLRVVIAFLRELNQDFVVEKVTGQTLSDAALPLVEHDALSQKCDMIIVVGGDGSLLHAAHAVIHNEVPVLGINRGRLGFLTDIHPTEVDKIKAILDGDYILEKRFLLSASAELQGKILGSGTALNEVAIIPDSMPHMNEFEIYIDDKFVCSQHADGLIIATPTGSTAYALSGGGPILHPNLDAIVIVPMFSHTLSIRPLVIEGDQRVTVIVTPNNPYPPRLTCDSQGYIDTPRGSHITIQKNPERLHLIHPLDYDYYETLRSKLHWGHKLQYKEE
ncbi:MAG TPA: NAD(+) kinase [Gammaproteobacteria bacterium]|jgi:NAD+ kinase|nr:NAD(+) kinase [Gammaproteobacteria bacterium]